MTRRYDILDGMRGVAAMCVMFMHTSGIATSIPNSYIAVDFFFILSGFVIAHAYDGRAARMGLGGFMIRRLIRLYPMFLFGMVAGALAYLVNRQTRATDFLLPQAASAFFLNLFYLPYIGGSRIGQAVYIFPLNSSYWSLLFELVVNLFFINLMALTWRRLVMFVAVAYMLIIAISVLLALGDGRVGVAVDSGWGSPNFVGGLPRVFYGFGCGVLLYKLAQTGAFVWPEAVMQHLRGRSYLLLLFVFGIFICPLVRGFGAVYYLIAVGLAAPASVIFAASADCETAVDLRVCKVLGWLSYPIYCLHIPVIIVVQLYYSRSVVPDFVRSAICCMITIVIAVAVTKLYEEPLRRWLRSRLRPEASGNADFPLDSTISQSRDPGSIVTAERN